MTNWKNRIVRQETVRICDIVPNAKNWRKHPAKQQTHVKGSLENLGWIRSVLVNLRTSKEWEIPHRNKKTVIDGHLRLDLALKNGEDKIPVEYVDLSPDEEKIALASIDPLAAMAETDEKMLDALLSSIDCDVPEITDMLGDIGTLEGIEQDEPEPQDTEPQISRAEELRKEWGTELGQMWQCGEHRVICGDCTDPAVVKRVMQGEKADLLLTDPPYGISVVQGKTKKVGGGGVTKFKGKVGGNNRVESREYNEVIGDESTDAAKNALAVLTDIKNKIIFGGNYFTDFLPPSRCWIVWDKENTGNFADAELAWTSFDQGVRLYHWLWNGLSRKGERAEELKSRVHPTQKPVGLFKEILKDFSEDGHIILDPFLGSGTTMIACENLGRKCRGMEIDPGYVAVILQRYKDTFPGKEIRLIE